MEEAALSLFGSLLHPYWRESEAQLTEKQAVLLMHDTLPQGVKSIRALLQKKEITYNDYATEISYITC